MKLNISGSKYAPFITAAAVSAALYFAFCALFALLLCFFDINRAYLPFLSTVALSLACFIGSFFAARRAGGKGYAIGGVTGLICFAAVTCIAAFVSQGRFTLNTLFHFLLIVLSSTVGGILGVNSKRKKII